VSVLTPRRLNRATLARQLLLARAPLPVSEAVRRVVALQAQEPASPYLALWNRIAPFDPLTLDDAFAAQQLVKASLMRITLHVVHRDDYGDLYAAMLPNLRAARLADQRFAATGMRVDDADALLSVVREILSRPRTRAEIEAALAEHLGGPPAPGLWWALRTYAPVLHAVTGGPWSYSATPSYVAAPDRPATSTAAGVRHLIVRYLEAFGPATVADIAQFSLLQRRTVREALTGTGGSLELLRGGDGAEYVDVPDAPIPDDDTPAPPRLMAMWDSVLLAYADRSRVIPPEYRRHVIRVNGDVLPTLLVDGLVAGVWRPHEEGVEVTAFHRLADETWQAVAAEAKGLTALLAARDRHVYARHANWWRTLPAAEVEVLPA
jgi:hypothetical protein